ncbi:MAG TPA: PH domain-containing protein, partial [Blastocatellia bacterium]
QPRGGIIFRGSDLFLIPFSLMWGGFAIFWEAAVLTTDGPFFFKLWGIPFVTVGLYMIFGRFLVDARQRKQTYYGVTNERVIIVSGIFSKKVKSLNLRTLSDISVDEKSDGSGTITFGPSNPSSQWFGGAQFPGWQQQAAPAFDLIPNAKNVYEVIRDAQRKAV